MHRTIGQPQFTHAKTAMFRNLMNLAALPLVLLAGCASGPSWLPSPGAAQPDVTEFGAITTLAPAVTTPADKGAPISGATAWSGAGRGLIIGAVPSRNALRVFDASSGALLQTVAPEGDEAFDQPHRLHVIDDLLLVAERESGRIHLLQLPDFALLLTFGDGDDQPLNRAQSMWAVRMADWGYHLYVTDNYDVSGAAQNNSELRRRVKQYALSKGALGWSARSIRAFGEPSGDGQLYQVDALAGDATDRLLLIADIDTRDARRIRVYGVDGRYAGRSAGGGVFRSSISGLTLMTCGEESQEGLWLATDGGNNGHYLHTFDRDTLDYRMSFAMPPLAMHGSLSLMGNRVYTVLADGRVAGFDVTPLRGLKAGC